MQFLQVLQIVAIVLWAHAGCIWLQIFAKSFGSSSNEEAYEAEEQHYSPSYEADYCCYVGFFGRINVADPDPEAQRYNVAFRALEKKAENCKSLMSPSEVQRRGLDKIIEYFEFSNSRCTVGQYVEKFLTFLDMTKSIRQKGDLIVSQRLRPPTRLGTILGDLFDKDDSGPVTFETLEKLAFNANTRKKFFRDA